VDYLVGKKMVRSEVVVALVVAMIEVEGIKFEP